MQRSLIRLALTAFAVVALACASAVAPAHAAQPAVSFWTRDPIDPAGFSFVPYTSATPGDQFFIRIDRTPGDTTSISADFDQRLSWFTQGGGACIGPNDANHMACSAPGDVIWVWFTVELSTSAAPLTFLVQYGGDKPAAYSLPYTPAAEAPPIFLPSFYR